MFECHCDKFQGKGPATIYSAYLPEIRKKRKNAYKPQNYLGVKIVCALLFNMT